MPRGVEPVSYTHLDVYKRQVKADLRSIDGQLIVAAVAPLLLAVEVMVQLAALVIAWMRLAAEGGIEGIEIAGINVILHLSLIHI